MSQFSHYAIQKALHATLEGDATLRALITGIYDYVPAKTAYPYAVTGDIRATDISTVESALQRVELELHIYSDSRGRKEIGDIMARIHQLLQDANPVMEGCICVSLRITGSEIRQERDGKVYHGRMRLTLILQQEETP